METPFEPRGTYEDLITLVLRLSERMLERDALPLPKKHPWQRLILEFPINLIGAAIALLLRLLPPRFSLKFHLFAYDWLSNYKYHSIGKETNKYTNSAELIYKYFKKSGREPGILCLASHPPVIGEGRNLNLGLMSAGCRIMRTIRGEERRFRLLLAVDSYALDTLHVYEEAIYAGVMGLYDIGVDRYPSTRNAAQRLLFRSDRYERTAFRLAESMREGENVVMVLSGGVAETSRCLYTTREFLWALRRRSSLSPSSVTRRFAELNKGFALFSRRYPTVSGHWRRLDEFFVACVAGDPLVAAVSRETKVPCETGLLEESILKAFSDLAIAFDLPREEFDPFLADFTVEFNRISPYRLRFFSFLLRRIVQRGTNILIQPLDHSADPKNPILMRNPIGLTWRDSQLTRVSAESASLDIAPLLSPDFFKAWGTATFDN